MPHADKNRLNETQRIRLLQELHLLKEDSGGTFDRLTRITTQILEVPVSLVSMVDDEHQWFPGCTGLPEPYASTRETPLSHSFCQHVVAEKSPLIIEDAREHPLVHDNLAIPDLNVIAYLGIPVVTVDGVVLGSFCAIDDKPRDWSDRDITLMVELAASVMTEIELRAELRKRRETEQALTESIREREFLRTVKQMTQSISHDLRNPLSSIQLKTELLGRRVEDDYALQTITYMKSKLAEVRNILDSFTMLWSVETDHAIKKSYVNMHSVIEEVVHQIEGQQTRVSKSVVVDLKLLADNVRIAGQQQLLSVMMSNLLENAIIFGKDSGVSIVITTENVGDELVILIEDNGIGIPEDDLPHIFDPLYKVNKARTTEKSASGLGLTVVRQIVDDHSGKIIVNSKLGEGSQFTIRFPIKVPHQDMVKPF
mgnify:CR=1 FL=1